jgi:hypothetical protein
LAIDTGMDINYVWENIRKTQKSGHGLGYYELIWHEPQFKDECSKRLAQWKQAK